jgi:hypothetical protein
MATISLFDKGLRSDMKQVQIKDLPDVLGDINKASVKFPNFYAYLKTAKKWDDAKFLRLSCISAWWNEAVWSNHGVAWDAPQCLSRIGVRPGEGHWLVNYPLAKAHGQYIGEGPQTMYYDKWAATTFQVWKAEWLGPNVMEMHAMESTTWNMGDVYTEGSYVDMIGFVGNNSGWYDPTYQEAGLALWDDGEVTGNGRIYSRDHNGYGIRNVRGTPGTFQQLSVFTNALGGVGLIGTELNTINLGTISGDDNPALVVMDAGYGRGGGGVVTMKLGKSESGKRTPNKGQIILWQKAPCYGMINIDGTQMAMDGEFVDAAFVMNTNLNSGGQILTGLSRGWNCRTLVHDITNKKRWAVGAYAPMHFSWASKSGGVLSDLSLSQQIPGTPVNATDRLGKVPNNGQFDYVAGTPTYDITGGVVPPQCTWILGTPVVGQCINGVQTTTTSYVPSIAGCTPSTPKPPDLVTTAPCGTPKTLWPVNHVPAMPITTTSTTKLAAPVGMNATKLILTACKFTVPANTNCWISDALWIFGTTLYTNMTGAMLPLQSGIQSGVSFSGTIVLPKAYSPQWAIGNNLGTGIMSGTFEYQ